MRRWLRLGLCLGLLTVALACSALAATPEYTKDEDGTVNYANGKYTASYTGVTSGNQYALLVVKATKDGDAEPINDDTLMYIDQKEAESETISFDFIPKSTPDCVVLLGGVFDGGTGGTVNSPVTLGTLIGQGVTVSGTVNLQGRSDHSGATVTLTGEDATYTGTTDMNGAYTLNSVTSGSYKLTITMPGYLSYTKTTLTVEDAMTVDTKNLLGGDVDASNQVAIGDLSAVLDLYLKESTSAEDINGSGQVTMDDLTILLGNYLKEATEEN